MFNFNHLYYFYLFAQMGSVSAAARQLHISQPALSAQLKDFELVVGRKLMKKEGRHLCLTPDGQYILESCRRIFSPAQDLWQSLDKQGTQGTRRMHLGVSTDVERPFVAEVISHFLRGKADGQRPRVTLTSVNPKLISEQLKEKLFDAIIVDVPTYDSEIEDVAAVTMPVMLAYSRRLGVISSRVDPGNIRSALGSIRAQWVMPASEMRLRLEIDRFLEKKKITPDIVFESDVLASVVCAVAEGAGVCLLPKCYIDRFRIWDSIVSYGPEEGYWKHSVWLCVRKGDADDAQLRVLRESFLAVKGRNTRK